MKILVQHDEKKKIVLRHFYSFYLVPQSKIVFYPLIYRFIYFFLIMYFSTSRRTRMADPTVIWDDYMYSTIHNRQQPTNSKHCLFTEHFEPTINHQNTSINIGYLYNTQEQFDHG